jgi:hypothetical protein
MDKKIITVLTALLMFSSVFGLISAIPVASASPPPSSVSNTSYLNSSVSYWQNVAISNSGTTNVNIPIQENSSFSQYSFGSGSSWTLSSNDQAAYWTQTFSGAPNYVYLNSVQSQNTLELDSIAFALGDYVSASYQELGTVYANMTIGGYTETWSHTFNFNGLANSYYAVITPQWNFYSGTPWYLLSDASSATLHLTATTIDGNAYVDAPIDLFTTTVDQGQNTIASSISTSVDSVPFAQGYYYGSSTSSFTPSSDLTSFDLSWSGPFSSTQVTYSSSTQTASSGTFTGNIVSGSQSVGFGISGDPSDGELTSDNYYVTGSYYLSSQVQAQQTSATQSYSSAQNPSENQNWWNSTSSFTLSPPSGALNNPSLSTTSGTINAETTMTWSINHILSVGYGQSPPYDEIYYSGNDISSSSFVPSSQYNSISQSSSTVIDSSTALSYSFDELINYNPSTPTLSTSFSNTGSQANLNIKTGEQISGERENIQINWGDGTITSLTNVSSGTQSTQSHTYSGTYQGTFSQSETIIVTVTNLPNGNPSGNDQLSTSNSTVYTFGMTDNPTTPNSILKVGQPVYMNITTTNLAISGATVSVNGLSPSSATLVKQKGSVYDFKFSSTLFGVSGVTITWTIDPAGITDIFSTQYATPIEPTTNSSYVTALFSNKATHSYPISLSGVPNGTGFYQQLITISNPSSYGINKAGSNIQFTASNGTLLYAWEQSINSSALQVWIKNFNGSSTIDMQVLPSFENDFSENGYLGKANTTTDNGWKVFPIYFSPYSLEDGLSETYNEPSSTYSVSTYDGTKTLNVTGLLMSNITLQNRGKYAVVSDYYGTAKYGEFGLLYNTDTTNLGGYAVFVDSNSGSGSYFQVQTMNNSYGGSPQYGSPNSLLRTTYLVYNGTGSSSIYGGVGTTPLVAVGQNLVYSATLSLATGDLQSEGNVPMHLTFSTFGALQTSYIMYSFVYDYIGNMPTISSITSGSVFQANATADNTTSQHYASFGADSVNLTDGEYTYSIPDSFNSNYITIYYNPAWKIDYASYGFAPGVQATSSGTMPYLTFAGVSGIGTLTMTFTEPLVIGQPLGTMSLGVLPSVAVGGDAFFELPNDLLHWTANGVPINPSGFSVVVGKPVSLDAFMAGSNDPIYSTTYTPTKQVTFLQTYVNISEFQFNNLNSTDEVSITATNANGTTQAMPLVGPYGTGASSQVVYLPSGKYTFRYTQLNYTSGEVVPGTSTATSPLANYSGEYWVTLSGVTIFQLGNQLKYTNSSIQKSIQSLSVIIALNDSAIKNLTLGVDLNLTATNSSIQKVLQNILVNDKFINDTILNENLSLQARLNTINSVINSFQSNITVLDTYINDTVNTINKIVTTVNTNLTTVNSVVGEIKVIDSQNFTALNSTVKNNYLKLISSQNFINSTVLAANNNITLFYKYQNDLINTTTDNIEVAQTFTNDTVNYIKSLETKINQNLTLTNATINEVKFIAQQNFTALNSTVKNNYVSLVSNQQFIESLVNSSKTSIIGISDIINSTVHDVSTNVTLFQNYVKDYINATVNNIKLEENFMNDTINKVNNNITLFQTYVKTTINATLNNVQALDTFINSTVKKVNNNVTLDEQFVNDTVHTVSNNLTLFNNYVHTTINDTINNIQVITSVVNSTVHDVSTNITLFNNYVHDTINATITDIHDENLIINSTVHAVSTNVSLFQTYVKDTINTTLTDVNLRDQYINDTVGVISNNVTLLQTYTKDVIHSEINNLSVVSTYINDTMGNMNISFNDKVAILNSTLNNVNLNSTTYFQIEHDILNNIKANQTDIYRATELSGAYSYKLIPENVTTVPKGIEMQLWVANHDGTIVDDPQLVYFLWKNMSAEIISVGGQNATRPILISYNAHYMTVEFYLNATQVNNLESGSNNTVLQLYSPFTTGGIANIATGSISPATTTFNQGIWEELGFSTSPPPWTGTSSIPAYITWILYNAGGRAIAGIVAIATLLYIVIMLYRKDKKKGRTKRQILTDKKVDAIYDNIVGNNQ